MTRTRAAFAAALALATLAPAGCGGEGRAGLTVSAAASLKTAFTSLRSGAGTHAPRFSFAGSDQLAAQIRAGARPDVLAAANTKIPQDLFAAGLVERPIAFASNRLVVAVPTAGSRVRTLGDLGRPGLALAVGSPTVPIGAYTQQVLARLPVGERRGLEANVRSREPDVSGIVGKVAQGGADAGLVYVTDVRAAGGRLRTIELPARLRPRVAYAAAVVRGGHHTEAARVFVRGLLSGPGRRALLAAGFEPPP